MAFQDFGQWSERRRIERQQKFRKRVFIAAFSVVLIILLVAVGVFVAVSKAGENGNGSGKKTASAVKPQKQVSHNEKAVKSICATTDYKQTCENSLSKISRSRNATLTKPKELVKAAISAVSNGLQKAFNDSVKLNLNTPKAKNAYEDCTVLIQNAQEELDASISLVAASSRPYSVTQELNNWLSAVMSYQATCIDGFSEGPLKTRLNKTFQSSRELTSNALAIVSQVTSILSSLQSQSPGANRHLLADDDGLPSWMTSEDRRILKPQETPLNPNATVAKDGSGNFTTISAALAAMPAKFPGRYIHIYIICHPK